ncbi:Pentatricopeptide repeat-containing protein [Cardamine amara subsp. amara]|uniref:Pentatricopeptide repeat-containing protein n=1 Tax=Cardamine amara subsp. amara TaxID=228776 RepID=A0ABD0ZBI9_CARAN
MRRSLAIASTAERFVRRSLLEKGKLGTSFSHCSFWVRAFSGLSHEYRGILRNGLRDIKLENAVDLFSEMVQSRPFPSIIEFNKLLSAIAKMKKFDLVISLAEQMQKFGISHDLYT